MSPPLIGVLELDGIMQGSLQSFCPSQLKEADEGRTAVERKGKPEEIREKTKTRWEKVKWLISERRCWVQRSK